MCRGQGGGHHVTAPFDHIQPVGVDSADAKIQHEQSDHYVDGADPISEIRS